MASFWDGTHRGLWKLYGWQQALVRTYGCSPSLNTMGYLLHSFQQAWLHGYVGLVAVRALAQHGRLAQGRQTSKQPLNRRLRT